MLYAVESALATELEPGDIVRVGDKRYHILALNTLVAAGEIEIECEDAR